jgi:hypothetical protein
MLQVPNAAFHDTVSDTVVDDLQQTAQRHKVPFYTLVLHRLEQQFH